VRTFFQTAGMDTERQDGQITIRQFDPLDKTKDLAGIGKSQRVLSTGAGVGVAGVVHLASKVHVKIQPYDVEVR
jgi:hypothetical protein